MKYIKKTKLINLLMLLIVIVIYFFMSQTVETYIDKRKQPIYKVDTQENKVAITFDVNWTDKEYLYDILDILDKYQVKATFFVMGKWIVYPDSNLEKIKAIYERGHEIGNHSYSHQDFARVSKEKMIDEIRKTEDTIYQAIGVKTELFRFPSGSYNDTAINVVEELGYKSIHWDVDSVDWKQLGSDVEYNRVMKKVKSGSIILFHNNGKYTPGNLDRIIPELESYGYEFVKISDLIYKSNYVIDNEGIQREIK